MNRDVARSVIGALPLLHRYIKFRNANVIIGNAQL